jgi:hypothetical protein
MCFYGDTAYALFLYVVCRYCMSDCPEESLKPVTGALIGIFGHGVGHLYFGLADEGKEQAELPGW